MVRTVRKNEKIGLLAMDKELKSLLELQRKTKAGEVAPLVDVPIKNFWLWPGKAYWAYVRREKIAVRQLELRKENRLASDKRAANVVSLCKQLYDEASWPERGELFLCLMADDSWSTVATLVDEDAVDDLGLVHFWEKIEQQYGKLTLEEMDMIAQFKTVGELAAFLEKVLGEGREKGSPCNKGKGLSCIYRLWVIVVGIGLIWLVGYGLVRLVHWLA